MNKHFYTDFEERFKNYAAGNDNIRAAYIMGSRARKDHPADQWSDLDICIYCIDPEKELRDETWLSEFGKVIASGISKTVAGDVERLTLFDGGYQVDTVYFDIADLQKLLAADKITGALARGIYSIIDKDNLLIHLDQKEFNLAIKNTLNEERFLYLTNQFWFISTYIVKQALRGNLWTAKNFENELKNSLLIMIEWHEKMTHGDNYDTWYGGKFINEWASAETLASIKEIYTGYSTEEIIKAVKASIKLFEKISLEVSNYYKFEYPYQLMESVSLWISKYPENEKE